MGVVVAKDVEFEGLAEGLALGELLLDQFSRNFPLLRHIAGGGDEDPNELRQQFAHVAHRHSVAAAVYLSRRDPRRQSNGGGTKPPNSRSIRPAKAIVVRSSR